MITTHLPLGDVRFSAEYFSTLVGEAAKNCYGVAAMAPRGVGRHGQEPGPRRGLCRQGRPRHL